MRRVPAPPDGGSLAASLTDAAPPPLTDLTFVTPGLARWRHGMVGGRGPREKIAKAWRFSRRVCALALERSRAVVLDRLDAMRVQPDPILRMEDGDDPMPAAHSVALFVQFSAGGALTAMVRRQLETYRSLGFAVVLVSNSPVFPEESWQEARRIAALVVHRRNRHLDFGAWQDVAAYARVRWAGMDELLLVNDSVLGPIRPLDPYFAAMRAGGPGFFGMLESVQGGTHLQSWLVLARGEKAVGDLLGFLRTLRLSRSKWTIVRRGELRMTRRMHEAGNRVAAVFGYAPLVETVLRDDAERAYLDRAVPGLLGGRDRTALLEVLMDRPLNPAHHLWRALIVQARFPFIKTELIRRNPGRLPGVKDWPSLVPPGSPSPIEELQAHLAAQGA